MSKENTRDKDKLSLSVFELIFLMWAGVVILSITLSILGIFYPIIIGIYLLLFIFVVWRSQKRKCCRKDRIYSLTDKLIIKKMSFAEKILLSGVIILTVSLSSFTVPTIFGGRDEGSLSNSAFLINQNHGLNQQSKLINTFGLIYGEGKALNFPGFFYQKNDAGKFILKSQFLPGYSSYLANFAYTSNLSLLKFANALPLIVFLLSFYSIIKLLTKSVKSSILGTVLLALLVPVGLFYKFTLSEIFFASLLWSSLYFLIKYLQLSSSGVFNEEVRQNYSFCYWMIFIPLLPAVFIRIEALGIIFTLILILILKSYKQLRKPNYQTPILLIVLLSAISLFVFSNFFIIALKGFLGSALTSGAIGQATTEASSSFIPKNWRDLYLLKLFYSYNLIPLFFFAILGVWKLVKEKAWLLLTPLFLLAVTGIYLVDANISTDHPWMLRRFVFSIIPLAVLYTIIFLQRYPLRRQFLHTLIISLLIVSSALMVVPFITFQQNLGLAEQVATLSKEFKSNDLILVSQKSSGSGWSLISEPLRNIHNKQAVYFFNPEDYAKIDKSQFNKIYLIVSKEEIDLYDKKLSLRKVKDYTIKNQLIKPTKNPLQFPKFIITETKGAIYKVN
jgi:hypothetical protein